MRLRTTSTQRTYRYVRLSLIGATVLLAVAVAIDSVTGGVPASLSASYYTSAGPAFVGSLMAVALALVALSGRSVEQGLLDVAAVLALVIAAVPTTVVGPPCPGAAVCVPPSVVASITTTGGAVAVVVVLGVMTAVVLARVHGSAGRGTIVTIVAVSVVTFAFVGWAVLSFASFLAAAHNVAAIGFFLLIALGAPPWILVGEALAVGFFALFWVVQTIELWNEPDPALRA
ncbi:hypothetical protein [Microbacterium trichothecenolyticum]|uniref:Uncharacterized protein n=1 Tax=Microbacterium trichothecenolyticum TaxID=69370 RepID=A0ABU0TPH7_MICTR|nr:hypothetical protein [Microbacterium trichothecenolyticum]MDQ1121576.1 hypothetical protein [Microbacterium trichothecenolyticum]